MSKLSFWLRGHGFGGIADAFKGVEHTVITAVQTSPQLQTLETTTVDEVGEAAKQTVVNAITKINPKAGEVSNEVLTPLLAAVDATVTHFLQGATTTSETKPPAA